MSLLECVPNKTKPLVLNKMKQYEILLRHDNPIILGHKINQVGVLPGVALLDLVYRTLGNLLPIEHTSLSNCLFHEAISFVQRSEKKIRIELDDAVLPHIIRVLSLDLNQEDSAFVLNFECQFNPSKSLTPNTLDIHNLKQKSQHSSSFKELYEGLKKVGIVHDDFMQVQGEIFQAQTFYLLELNLSEKARRYLDKFTLHPAMLDAATIASIIPIYQEISTSNHAYIPITLEYIYYQQKIPDHCYVFINKQDVIYLDDIMKASVALYAPNGELVADLGNLVNKRIRNQQHSKELPKTIKKEDPVAPTEVQQVLINLLNQYLNDSVAINPTENFYNLGLDSQSLIDIVHQLEQLTGAELYPTLLFEYNNIHKLSQYLSQQFPHFGTPLEPVVPFNQSINFFRPQWIETAIQRHPNIQINHLLVIANDTKAVAKLRTNSQLRVIHVLPAAEFCMLDENNYKVNLHHEASVQGLLKILWAQGIGLENIIYSEVASLYEPTNFSFAFPVALLLKNLKKLNVQTLRLMHCYAYEEQSINSAVTLVPYFKSLQLEDPNFHYLCLGMQDFSAESYLVEGSSLFLTHFTTAHYLMRGQKCYELHYSSLPSTNAAPPKLFTKHNPTFIISGGAGKIGLALAQQLVAQQNATVYLLGRAATVETGLNHQLHYVCCDITNQEDLSFLAKRIKGQTIDAVFHCAGVLKDALHENTELIDLEQILNPKWKGTINLYDWCKELNIGHLFLFSSLTSVLGNVGQTHYAMANAFLDEFARAAALQHQQNPTLPVVLSINWPLWQDGGMANAQTEQILMKKWGLAPITTELALTYMQNALASAEPQTVLGNEVIHSYLQSKKNPKPFNLQEASDIAIIGLAGRYPLAQDLEEFWNNLCSEKNCVSANASSRFPTSPYPFGGFLEDIDKFDPQFFGISPKDAKIMDPQERLFLQTAWHTFEDAGYGSLERSRYQSIGVFVGAMFSLYQLNKNDTQLTNSSFASIANRVSYCLDLNGPSLTLDTMCSSSLTALHYACESIKAAECQLALVGGVNLISHASKYDELLQRGFLSKEGACQVFSANADGYVPGEGVGALLIKRLDRAIEDKDHIYGVIKGSAINHSGKSDGYTVPSIEYQTQLLCSVLDKTNIHPTSISYIEAHGTGTALGDPIELKAITNAYANYSDKKHFCAIGSVKSNIGHLESAAGIAGLTKILLQMKYKKLVPSINTKPANPNINLLELPCVIQDKLSDWVSTKGPRRAALSGFGAGGTNVHCILEEYVDARKEQPAKVKNHLFLCSAKSAPSLKGLLHKLSQWLAKAKEPIDLQALSLTLVLGRDHFPYRSAFIANSVLELKKQLDSPKVAFTQPAPLRLEEITSLNEASLYSLAYYYQTGAQIDWAKIATQEPWHKLSLPSYCFDEEAYWVDVGEAAVKPPESCALNFYTYQWVARNLPKMAAPRSETNLLVLFDVNSKRYEALKETGMTKHLVLITVAEDGPLLLQQMVASGSYQQVIILYFLSDKNVLGGTVASYTKELEHSFLNFHKLCQSVLQVALPIPLQFKYFYRTSTQRPVCAAVSAYLKTLMRENSKVSGQVIKLDEQNYSELLFADLLHKELSLQGMQPIDLAYTSDGRFYKNYEVISDKVSAHTANSFVKKNGVYLIIGGLGKLGLIIANYLASIDTVQLILIGRKKVDETLVQQHLSLQKTGSTANYYACDVGDFAQVVALIKEIKATKGTIQGIINSSSVLKFSPVFNKSSEEILSTLATKSLGTNNLDLATADEALDWFVCFSSLASVIGFPEGCDYAFGNAYLDEFVLQRNQLVKEGKRFGRTIAFNWPVWQDGGMIKKNADTQRAWEEWMIKTQGVVPMSKEQGLSAFAKVMNSQYPQVLVAEGYDDLIQKTLSTGFMQRVKEVQPYTVKQEQQATTDLQEIISNTIAELLELPQNKIDLHQVFTDFGFDSMTLITFAEQLSQKINIEILPSIFFSENSIHKLTQHLTAYYQDDAVEKKQIASGLEFAFTEQVKPLKNLFSEDIAIVGMDGKFPNSDDLDAFWQNLVEGVDLISEIPADRWSWQDYYHPQPKEYQSHSKWGGFLKDMPSFDADFFKISDTEAQMMDPQHRLFLEVAWRAIENAGQPPEALAGKAVGVFVGVQFNDYQSQLFANDQTNFYIATGNSHALIANRLSYLLDLNGPSEAIDTACSSALVALNRAVNAIKLGECESAIVGATTCILNPMSYVVTSQLGIISPEGKCKVFDAGANGYVKGEGVGVLWLMPLQMAQAHNYPIHAVIKGVGVNHGGKSTSLTAPNIKAQQQLLVNTYKKSNIALDSISYIETHGTGTLLGDSIEIESIKAAFIELVPETLRQKKSHTCSLGSVKSNAGHLEPAAGIIGLIKILLMLKHATKVKNLHLNTLSPYIKLENTPFKIQDQGEDWVAPVGADGERLPKRAAISSFGFGGANAHVILEEYIHEPFISTRKPYYLCVLSAKTKASLHRQINALAKYVQSNPKASLEALSYTLNAGRSHYPHRCALVVDHLAALQQALTLIGTGEASQNVFFSSENNPGAINQLQTEMHDYLQDQLSKYRQDSALYLKKLQSLAILYTQQVELNWALLHAEESQQRIALPSYSFEKKHYWLKASKPVTKSLVGAARFLGENRSTADAFHFTLNLDPDAFFIKEHQVNQNRILPGVMVFELLYELLHFVFPKQSLWKIKEIYWLEPITAELLAEELSISLHECNFTLRQEDKVFAKGSIKVLNKEVPQNIDLNTLRVSFTHEYAKEHIYQQFSTSGIEYGKSFQTIEKAYFSANEVLSQIKLVKPAEVWRVHPCIFDAALQSLALFFPENKNTVYLYGLEEVILYEDLPLESSYFAHLQQSKEQIYSLKLYDQKGRLYLSVAKIIIKTQAKVANPLSCLTTQWHEASLTVSNCLAPGRILIVKTLGVEQIFYKEESVVLEWDELEPFIQGESLIDFPHVYILFNAFVAIEEMAGVVHKLVILLDALVKRNTLHLRFITFNAFKTSPFAVSLTGLIHSLHQEHPDINVTCMDVAPQLQANATLWAMIKNEPAQTQSTCTVIDEQQKRWVRHFSAEEFPELNLKNFRVGGVYLIVGGAQGVGFELAQFLAKNYQARLVLVGRRSDVSCMQQIKTLQALGGQACYYQADVGQEQAMQKVFAQVDKEYGRLHGVIHSALVLDDKPLTQIDLGSIERVLNPKVLGTITLCRLLKERSLDFLLFFSSAQSYMNNGGQSTYALASLFQDQFAKQFRAQVSFPIKVVNWGYWGTVGVVANDYYQQQMHQKGIYSINPAEAFKVLEQFLISSLEECIILAASTKVIEQLTFDDGFQALEEFSAHLLLVAFQEQGVFKNTENSYSVPLLLESLSVKQSYQPLFVSLLHILQKHNLVVSSQSQLRRCQLVPALRQMQHYPDLNAHVALVQQCIASLFMVLQGQKRHTEVLFPENQRHLVEQVYTHHPISKAIHKQLAYAISAAAEHYPDFGFTVLEIGAGTGSATVEIIRVLQANRLKINYIFTDISQSFLNAAKINSGLDYEGLQFQVLDISKDPLQQGFAPSKIDLVLANNVLHATGNISTSLAHIHGLLKNEGQVLINELTQNSNFLTTTFGLTPEWWRVDPREQTIDHSPLLNVRHWCELLVRTHFGAIETPLFGEAKQHTLADAQQVIKAKKLGIKDHASEQNLKYRLKNVFAEILKIPVTEINEQVTLAEYGLDSLVTLEATARLKKEFSNITNTVLFEYNTIESLVDYIQAHNLKFTQPQTQRLDYEEEKAQSFSEKDIAIIGYTGRFPGAQHTEQLWDLLVKQHSALTEVPQERGFSSLGYFAGFLDKVEEFDALAFNISPREAEKMDPQERLFLECCWNLFERTGYTKAHLAATCAFEVGVFVGAMNTDYSLSTFTENQRTQHHATALWSIANRVSYFFNLRGPSLSIDTACASSLTAIHMACQSIREGECQLAVAGGVNLILHPNHFATLAQTNMLSSKNYCQPFTNDSEGMIIGEGVGAILLKPLAQALKDKDKIHAVIKGSHVNSSGKTKGYMVPNPSVQESLMNNALKRAGVENASISYIETQGTGTKLGDEIEIEALQRVYGESKAIISSLKPNIGHLEAAAGIAGLIKIVLQFRHQTILPVLNGALSNQSVLIKNAPFALPEQQQEWSFAKDKPRRAALSAFGAGGSNAHLIIEEFRQNEQSKMINQACYLFLISAKNDDSLTLGIRNLYDFLQLHPDLSPWDLSYTLAVRREHFNYRCALIASSVAELLTLLKAVAEENIGAKAWRSEGKVAPYKPSLTLELIHDEPNLSQWANRYIQGAELPWGTLFTSEAQIVELPPYAFIKQVYSNRALDTHPKEIQPVLKANPSSIEEYLLNTIASILKIAKEVLDPSENLLEYGFDSISLSHLLSAIEDHYQLTLTPIVVMEHSTVARLASYLQSVGVSCVA